jgi:hypothetical protein
MAYGPLGSSLILVSSGRSDPRGQGRFGDDAPSPHPLQQIVLSDDPVAVKHEEGQQIEDLGFEFDDLGAAAQFAARDVEPVVAKSQNHAPLRRFPDLDA